MTKTPRFNPLPNQAGAFPVDLRTEPSSRIHGDNSFLATAFGDENNGKR